MTCACNERGSFTNWDILQESTNPHTSAVDQLVEGGHYGGQYMRLMTSNSSGRSKVELGVDLVKRCWLAD